MQEVERVEWAAYSYKLNDWVLPSGVWIVISIFFFFLFSKVSFTVFSEPVAFSKKSAGSLFEGIFVLITMVSLSFFCLGSSKTNLTFSS